MHRRPSAVSVDNGKAQRESCDELDGPFNRFDESLGKLGADVGVPPDGLVVFSARYFKPDNGQTHSFGCQAFTCSQGMTAEGFCS